MISTTVIMLKKLIQADIEQQLLVYVGREMAQLILKCFVCDY